MKSFNENQIIYEDNHLLIINKKSGQIVQGDKTGDKSLIEELKNYLKVKYKKEGNVFLGLVHRIDRPTSGLVIFTKTSKALSRLTQDIKNHEIKKTYLAIVKKQEIPENQTLINYLKKNEKNNKSSVFLKPIEGAKQAILHYKIIKKLNNYFILEINLETGRHHQIRAQLSKIGIPIKGDLKYGFDRTNPDGSIHLNAHKLEFKHPITKNNLIFLSKLPKDILWENYLTNI